MYEEHPTLSPRSITTPPASEGASARVPAGHSLAAQPPRVLFSGGSGMLRAPPAAAAAAVTAVAAAAVARGLRRSRESRYASAFTVRPGQVPERWAPLRSSYTMRTKCAISDAFVRYCVFAYCASVAQYVYSLSAEHCFRLRNNAISDERVRYCALSTHSVFRPLEEVRVSPDSKYSSSTCPATPGGR